MAKRVLVVDDEKLIVKGIRFSLEQDGYGSGLRLRWRRSTGIWQRSEEYDIVLLDVDAAQAGPVLKCASRSANFPMCRWSC